MESEIMHSIPCICHHTLGTYFGMLFHLQYIRMVIRWFYGSCDRKNCGFHFYDFQIDNDHLIQSIYNNVYRNQSIEITSSSNIMKVVYDQLETDDPKSFLLDYQFVKRSGNYELSNSSECGGKSDGYSVNVNDDVSFQCVIHHTPLS